MTAAAPAPSSRPRLRAALLAGIAAVVVLGGVLLLARWLMLGRHIAETDNAYVGGDLVQVTAQVAGPVASVLVDAPQQVAAGDEVVHLDPSDARFARERAEADLGGAVRAVRQQQAAAVAAEAQVEARAVALRRAAADLERRERSADVVSDEDLTHARDAAAQARADQAAAQAALAQARALVDGTALEGHPSVVAAAARLRQALLDERRTVVRAPVSGQVVLRQAQPGARVQAGTMLLAIVPLGSLWVDANFKEGQLARIRPGQPVDLVADVYGPAVTYHGRVAGLSAGTGSAFALLPPQNASGNWIKVVQRVPVRIELDPRELAEHPLRIGLSMEARVRLDAEPLPAPPASTRGAADASGQADIEARVAAIIAANAGSTGR